MMKKAVLLILIVISGITDTRAFGEGRSGFILGTGIGVGYTGVFSEDEGGKQRMSDIGPALSFKIGYAPVDLFQVFLGFSFSMFRPDQFLNVFDPLLFPLWPILLPVSITQSSHMLFQLIGTTFYFSPETPSFVVGGGIGVSSVAEPFWNKTEGAVTGWLEAGYELARHFSVKLVLFPVRIEKEWYDDSTESDRLFHSVALSGVLFAEYCLY